MSTTERTLSYCFKLVLLPCLVTTVALADQEKPARILMSTREMPVVLQNASYKWDGLGTINGVSFQVRNQGGQSLIAYDVRFEIQAENGERVFVERRTDLFMGQDDIRAGDSRTESDIKQGVVSKSPIRQVTAEVSFAEFADGTYFGKNAEGRHLSVEKKWAGMASAFRKLQVELDSRGGNVSEAYLRDRLLKLHSGTDQDEKDVAALLLSRMSVLGVDRVKRDIYAPRVLAAK